MNKSNFIYLAIFTLISLNSQAQNLQEAYNFSSSELNGTARYTAMGGAFGALGGDISAIKDNPAGSAIFLNNYLSGTLNTQFYSNELSIDNFSTTSKDSDIDINQIGAVFVFNNYNEDAVINKFTLGFTYDKTKSLDDFISWNGNTGTSFTNFFVDQAQGIPLEELESFGGMLYQDYNRLFFADFSNENFTNAQAQNAYMAYQNYLINPVENTVNNTNYISNVNGSSYNQEYDYMSTGFNGKFTGNAALAIKNKLYLGLNLNGHIINYERNTAYYETVNNSNTIESTYFEQSNLTLGRGFSFDVGAIYKLSNMVRIGANYSSPTWYTIHDETSHYLQNTGEAFESQSLIFDPQVINVYPEYSYKSPSKLSASLGFIFGTTGILSFEYSYKDYSNIEYSSDDYNFNNLNSVIQNSFTSTSTLKLGGEYRIKRWSARAGYQFVETPYEDDNIVGNTNTYSLGLGYNLGDMKIDISYFQSSQDNTQSLYQTSSNNTFNIGTRSNIAATFSINL
ncbi:hypothetical protein [Mesonia sp.]|uniref:OmpP1/FadL family transporter n=1 Tax=Mesonia sp. TaxID=1960830 RepID=UPI00175C2023|nr:hypothetical protein [Mesonia sp.]HIB38636.1 hypothetical protein [Mesonia sp.]